MRLTLLYLAIGALFWGVRMVYESMLGLRMDVGVRFSRAQTILSYACGISLAIALWPAIAPPWIWAVWTHEDKDR
jgi:hypothetical protein